MAPAEIPGLQGAAEPAMEPKSPVSRASVTVRIRGRAPTSGRRPTAFSGTHLKVSLTVPPVTDSTPAYGRAFFYGWIVTPDGNKLSISQCKEAAPACPFGFPITNGSFAPGDRVMFETDLPRSFVDAQGAHLHLGIGPAGNAPYYPTTNLLPIAHAAAAASAPASAVASGAPVVMTEELMARVIKYTRNLKGTGTLDSKVCRALKLCDGTADLELRLAKSDATDRFHGFGLPVDASSKDVLFMVQRSDTVVEAYLTDKTGTLRSAAVLENGAAHLIPNSKAAEKYKAELTLFAGEAVSLPRE